MGVGDAVGDGHHHRRGRAVAADVGDQDAPLAVGEREEVVVVAARPLRRLVVGGQVEGRDRREHLGQQRALDVGDDLQLALDEGGGPLQLLGEDQVVRRPAEEVARPDPFGELLAVERPGLRAHQDGHVEGRPPVVVREGHERALAGQVLGRRVVGVDDQVVDDPRLVAVDQLAQQAALEEGEAVLLLPGVDLVLPQARSRDAVAGRLEVAAAQRDGAVDRHELAHPRAVGADHRLRVGLAAHLAHGLDDRRQPTSPVVRCPAEEPWA